ncbi:hypothetical protein [Sphingobium sp. CFD-1]|uniref:hypothetical protein n=1 Tax=Sphingobium sp. CFD-1 TaxID=2878545 RepID=UPI00214CB784|nr:hypothetical protein [Sphingobium sp. CFD-1]
MTPSLPVAFADLEPFAHLWEGLAGMESRYRARQDMSFDALKQFYDIAAPRLTEIMAHLDGFGARALPPAEAHLYRVALGLVEASLAVEFFGAARLPGAPYPHHVAVGGQAALSD